MPWPDQIAVNGPMMHQVFMHADYPDERMIEVEALRYLGLAEIAPIGNGVLVLGEYASTATERLLTFVNRALDELHSTATYRPHPTQADAALPSIRIALDQHPDLISALGSCNVTICGPSSSAAVESCCLARSTIIVGDPHSFLGSPAEGMPGAILVKTAFELSAALAATSPNDPGAIPGVYHLEPGLPRWQALIHCS